MNLSENYERCLIAAKSVGRDFPYYTPASMRVRFEETKDVPTMSIDSKLVIRFNPNFIHGKTPSVMEGLVLHECMHYMNAHHRRYLENPHRGEVPWIVHNVAMDMEINQFIDYRMLPSDGFTPKTYNFPEGKSYEEYLLMLMNNQKFQSQMNSLMTGGSPDGQGENENPGQGKGDANDSKQGDTKCGDVDCEGYSEDGNQDESTRQQLQGECEAAQAAHDQQAGNSHSFSDAMKKIQKIKYPWNKVFKSLVTSRLAEKVRGYNYRTYRKPNKHLMGVDDSVIHGSYCDINQHLNLIIGMDISGSMYGLTEQMYGIMKSIVDVEELDISTTILECDTAVSRVIQDFDLEKSETSVGSGGGTDMGAINVYIKEQKLDPDLIVIMTDNYTDWDPVMFKEKTVVLTTHVTDDCPYKQFLVSF